MHLLASVTQPEQFTVKCDVANSTLSRGPRCHGDTQMSSPVNYSSSNFMTNLLTQMVLAVSQLYDESIYCPQWAHFLASRRRKTYPLSIRFH